MSRGVNGFVVSFGGGGVVKDVLNLVCGDGCPTVCNTKRYLIVYFRWVNFIIYELCLHNLHPVIHT